MPSPIKNRHTKLTPVLDGLLLALCLLSVVACSNISVNGGFGSETTNGKLTGSVLLPNGTPAAGAQVMVRRIDYVAPFSEKTPMRAGNCLTDTNGHFTLDSLDTGSYCVEVNDRRTSAAVTKCSIPTRHSAIDIGAATMQVYATVKGEMNIDATPSAVWYAQIYGLERCVAVDSTGAYSLNDLPAGTFRFRFICNDTSLSPLTLDNITAIHGATTVAPSIGWNFSRQLTLNTTPAGANIAGDVYRFPVLVRLTEGGNFFFNQARQNGEDVRFLSPSNRMLPYEIERWDSAKGLAEIWVLVDTIYGNNSSQFIVMLWGNQNARDKSNGASVFDTANGYSAVWHLGKNSNDATLNKNNAIACSALDTAGIIGYSKKFNGADSIKVSGLLGSPSSITLSAWAQLDTSPPNGGSEILSLGDAALIREDYYLGSLGTIGSIHLSNPSSDSVFYNISSGQFLKKTGWHLVTFTVDQTNHNQALYIDGTMVRSAAGKNETIDYSGVGQNTFIGTHGNGKTNFDFSGRIDEVRVCRAAVSADYIKLCYMNQKQNDALTVFK